MTAIQNPELTKVLTQTRSGHLEELDKVRRAAADLERQAKAAREQEAALELVIRALNEALFPVEGFLQPLTRPFPIITTGELLKWVAAAPKNAQLAIIENSGRESVFSRIESLSPLATPREWAGRRSIIRAENELIVSAYPDLIHFLQESFIDGIDLLVIASSTPDADHIDKSPDALSTRIAPQTVVALLGDA